MKVSTFSDCKTLGLISLQQTETLQADGIKRVKKTNYRQEKNFYLETFTKTQV